VNIGKISASLNKMAKLENRDKYPFFIPPKKVENRPYIYEVPSTAYACRL